MSNGKAFFLFVSNLQSHCWVKKERKSCVTRQEDNNMKVEIEQMEWSVYSENVRLTRAFYLHFNRLNRNLG